MLSDPVALAPRLPPQRNARRPLLALAAVVVTTAIVGVLVIVLVARHGSSPATPEAAVLPVSAAMPVGDLPADADAPRGWQQVFTDDFDVPAVAAADGTLRGGKWWGYTAGTKITNSTNGVYDPSRVVSVSGGAMHFRLHSEGDTAYAAVESPALAPQTYGRYSVRYRYAPGSNVAGFKSVWMLWPDSNRWGEGEIDFNEFDNEADRTSMRAALLRACGVDTGCPQTGGSRAADPTRWHVGTVIWAPGIVRAYLDGYLVAQNTTQVPSTPMHLLLQTEASDYGPTAAPDARARIDVDWVTVYTRR